MMFIYARCHDYRQLLKGVDGLKMMSEVLASIDKVTSADDVGADSERGATGGS